METPIEQLDEVALFTSVPLLARLQTGVESVLEYISKQREFFTEKAAEQASIKGVSEMPPEIRINSVSNAGVVDIMFSESMNFDADTKTEVNVRKLSSQNPLVTVFIVPQLEAEDGETSQDTKLIDWRMT